MAIIFPEGTQNYPSKLVDFDYVQSGTEYNFSIGNGNYLLATYGIDSLQVTTKSSTDIIFLRSRISWSMSDVDEEVGFAWFAHPGNNTWTAITADGAIGDTFNSRTGFTVGQHNADQNANYGYQNAVMDIYWVPGTATTYNITPGVKGHGATSSTMYVNRFASNNSSSNWDVKGSTFISAMVMEAP